MGRPLLLSFLMITCLYTEVMAQRAIVAYPLESAIVIDGIHEPGKWSEADSASGFFQMAPLPGEASSQKTIAYIGYDSVNIYVSVL